MTIFKKAICSTTLLLAAPAAQAQDEAAPDTAAQSAETAPSDAEPAATEASASASLSLDGADASASGSATPSDYYGMFKIDAFTGALFPSGGHNLTSRPIHLKYQTITRYMIGLRFGFYPVEFFGIEPEFMHARGAVDVPNDGTMRADFNAYRLQLVGQYPTRHVVPFVLAGGGAIQAISGVMAGDTDPAFHFGLGAKVPLGKAVGLRFDLRENMHDRIDDAHSKIAWSEEIQVGLTFNLDQAPAPRAAAPEAPPDQDGDTVPDMKDACPDVAALTEDGCPLDTDGDGVIDAEDYCPRDKGEAPKGCPDPDKDGDGIPLPCDLCPEEKGVAPDGCAIKDADGDGIFDDKDKCPKEPETKNGFEDQDGCPDEVPAEVKAFTGVIQGIEFDQGKATIRKVSERTLSKAAEVLTKFPTVRVEISGHTSSEGNADFNQKLSEERADAVKAWLVAKGINPDRIEARGAGSSEPLADNKTEANRRKNRRIEFKILQ